VAAFVGHYGSSVLHFADGCLVSSQEALSKGLRPVTAAATTVQAKFTQVCEKTGRVLHTTISTVQGKTTASFVLIADGVKSKIVVPIHDGVVFGATKLNETFKIKQAATYTAGKISGTATYTAGKIADTATYTAGVFGLGFRV